MAKKGTARRVVATPTTAAASPAPLPVQKRPKSFLDLTAELRLQVYSYLLPDREPYPGRPLRKDKDKCSTNFMTACKKVHGEAVDMLYGSRPQTATISNSGIRFLNQEVGLADAGQCNAFAALRQIRELDLRINADDTTSVCAVKDATFAFLRPITVGHRLQALEVHISVDMETDRSSGYEMFSSNYSGRAFKQNLMREFKNVQPGDISRPHLTAFLTDPLRMIRNVRDGKKSGKFTLSFDGKTGQPWWELPRDVRDLVIGNGPVVDYTIFTAYFEKLQALIEVAKYFCNDRSSWDDSRRLRRLKGALATQRIRGDVQGLHTAHGTLAEFIDGVIEEGLGVKYCFGDGTAEEREYICREMAHHLHELHASLPSPDADTSMFGYNSMDAKFMAWKDRRAEEKKSKRKKAGDDSHGGSKEKARS